jgi:hypothetical protein
MSGMGCFYSTGYIVTMCCGACSPSLLLTIVSSSSSFSSFSFQLPQFLRVKESGHNPLIGFSFYLHCVKNAQKLLLHSFNACDISAHINKQCTNSNSAVSPFWMKTNNSTRSVHLRLLKLRGLGGGGTGTVVNSSSHLSVWYSPPALSRLSVFWDFTDNRKHWKPLRLFSGCCFGSILFSLRGFWNYPIVNRIRRILYPMSPLWELILWKPADKLIFRKSIIENDRPWHR